MLVRNTPKSTAHPSAGSRPSSAAAHLALYNPTASPAPLPVPPSAQDPGYHVLKLTATETQGRTVILTGLNPETGHLETVIADRDRDSLFILDDAAKATLPTQGIETVGVGALVATRDPKTGHTEYRRVLRTFPHLAGQTITATFADVKTGHVAVTLTATPQHPFFVVGRGAVPLGQLGIGTQIVTRAGPRLKIVSLVKHEYPHGIPVYNFEVQSDHTYFVGSADGGMWVHNDCGINVALSVDEHLDEFAEQVGGKTYKDWGGDNWRDGFEDVMSNPNNQIHVNLDGPNGPINPWAAAQEGLSKGLQGRATSWEIGKIYSNPEWWARTTFYQGGVVVPNPFE